MSKILADHDIKRIINKVILNADSKRINPNGIELRLGRSVYFHSTGEESELGSESFLKVSPGETVIISSFETIDFRAKTVNEIFPNSSLMAFVTPTTTMMREGISQVATKIDAGFNGNLNWGLRNGSSKDLFIKSGEPIFKLTIFLLDKDESPEKEYGQGTGNIYQDTVGVSRSRRKIPVDIPKKDIVSSKFEKIDPKQKLKEAGYPFDHIGNELIELDGKFEVVSKSVKALKDEMGSITDAIHSKIDDETNTITGKLKELEKSILEKVDSIFETKFNKIVAVIIGALAILYGIVSFLIKKEVDDFIIISLSIVSGIIILIISKILSDRTKT